RSRDVLNGDGLAARSGVAALVGGRPGAFDSVLDLAAGGAGARQRLIVVVQVDRAASISRDRVDEVGHGRAIDGLVRLAREARGRDVLNGDGLAAGSGVAALVGGRPGAFHSVLDLAASGAGAGQSLIAVVQVDRATHIGRDWVDELGHGRAIDGLVRLA